MDAVIQPAAVSTHIKRAGRNLDLVLTSVCVGLSWLLLFDRLRVDWTVNPQYSYGWVVPLLGLALLWRRWGSRPIPELPARLAAIGFAAGALLFALLPLRLIQEANPEWRLILWLHAFQTAALSFCAVYYLGGGSWVKHFAFPIGFLLISVPWPTGLETAVIQNLMRFVALATVEVFDWLSIPAVSHGNVIEIAAGIVGVDEACSGVRSLQTTLLASLFVGELYHLGRARRWLLLAGGVLLAILANIGRTTFLVWAASAHGLAKMHVWHDGAGIAVVFVVLAGLWSYALWLRPRATAEEPRSFAPPFRTLPRRWVFAVAGWLIMVEATTEIWYRAHEADLVENTRWSIAWPTNALQFGDLEVGDTALAMLRCTEARGAGLQDADGNRWKLFFLQWDSGRNSAQLAKSHRPEICLQGVGLRLVSQLGVYPVNVNGALTLPFQQYLFENAGRPLHIFYCAWENQAPGAQQTLTEDGSHRSRLQAVLAGKRHLGQQTLELAVSGPESPEAARELLHRCLPTLVRH